MQDLIFRNNLPFFIHILVFASDWAVNFPVKINSGLFYISLVDCMSRNGGRSRALVKTRWAMFETTQPFCLFYPWRYLRACFCKSNSLHAPSAPSFFFNVWHFSTPLCSRTHCNPKASFLPVALCAFQSSSLLHEVFYMPAVFFSPHARGWMCSSISLFLHLLGSSFASPHVCAAHFLFYIFRVPPFLISVGRMGKADLRISLTESIDCCQLIFWSRNGYPRHWSSWLLTKCRGNICPLVPPIRGMLFNSV